MTETLQHAYPDYDNEGEANSQVVDEWVSPEFVHVATNENGVYPIPPDPKVEARYDREAITTREAILALPDHTEGLNLSRVAEHVSLMNGSSKPVKYLQPDDYRRAQAIVEMTDDEEEPEGLYIDTLEVSLVKRDEAMELMNGPAVTESFAIHEIAHSTQLAAPVRVEHTSTGRLFWKRQVVNAGSTRVGFRVQSHEAHKGHSGGLIEEGYAEFERGQFVERNNLVDSFTRGASNYDQLAESGIPMKYCYKAEMVDGQPILTIAPGAIVASIIDKLAERDSEIVPLFRESRRSVAGYRAFAARLDQLVPNLYPQLKHGDQKSLVGIIRGLNSGEL